MTIELEAILEKMEKQKEFPNTMAVMAELKKLAGKDGYCVVDVTDDGDGVIWQRVNGDSKTLTLLALEKRLARIKGRQ